MLMLPGSRNGAGECDRDVDLEAVGEKRLACTALIGRMGLGCTASIRGDPSRGEGVRLSSRLGGAARRYSERCSPAAGFDECNSAGVKPMADKEEERVR